MLGGERISYEPYPGQKFIPKKITQNMILGKDGAGIDNSPIKNSLIAFSQNVFIEKNEKLVLHLYPM